jgi:hypothetical protein
MKKASNSFTFPMRKVYTFLNNTPQAYFSAMPGAAQTEGLLFSGNMLFRGVLS